MLMPHSYFAAFLRGVSQFPMYLFSITTPLCYSHKAKWERDSKHPQCIFTHTNTHIHICFNVLRQHWPWLTCATNFSGIVHIPQLKANWISSTMPQTLFPTPARQTTHLNCLTPKYINSSLKLLSKLTGTKSKAGVSLEHHLVDTKKLKYYPKPQQVPNILRTELM